MANWYDDPNELPLESEAALTPSATVPSNPLMTAYQRGLAGLNPDGTPVAPSPALPSALPEYAGTPGVLQGLNQYLAQKPKKLSPEAQARANEWFKNRAATQPPKESEAPLVFGTDTLAAAKDWMGGLTTTVPAAFYRLAEDNTRPDQYSPEAKAAFAAEEQLQQQSEAERLRREKAGESTQLGSAIREAIPSSGFTVGSMAAALPAGLATGAATQAAIPVPGSGIVGGIVGSFAGSGTAAFRMARSMAMDEWFKQAEAGSMAKNKRPLTEPEKQQLYEELQPLATDSGLWEAGPEALGNAFMLVGGGLATGLIGKTAFRKATMGAMKKAGIRAGAAAVGAGMEFGTETTTELGQAQADARAEVIKKAIEEGRPIDPNEVDAAVSRYNQPGGGGAMQAFKDIAAPTLGTLVMFGLAGGAVRGGQKAYDRLVTNPQEAKAILEMANSPEVLSAMPESSLRNLESMTGHLQKKWFQGDESRAALEEVKGKLNAELSSRSGESADLKDVRQQTLRELWEKMAPPQQQGILAFLGNEGPGLTGYLETQTDVNAPLTDKEGNALGDIDVRGLRKLAPLLGLKGAELKAAQQRMLQQRQWYSDNAPGDVAENTFTDDQGVLWQRDPATNQWTPAPTATPTPPALPTPPAPRKPPTQAERQAMRDEFRERIRQIANDATLTQRQREILLAEEQRRETERQRLLELGVPVGEPSVQSADFSQRMVDQNGQPMQLGLSRLGLGQDQPLVPVEGGGLGGIEPTTPPTPTPAPGETVRLQSGESIVLTPPKPGEPVTRTTVTPEQEANLRGLLGERPVRTPPVAEPPGLSSIPKTEPPPPVKVGNQEVAPVSTGTVGTLDAMRQMAANLARTMGTTPTVPQQPTDLSAQNLTVPGMPPFTPALPPTLPEVPNAQEVQAQAEAALSPPAPAAEVAGEVAQDEITRLVDQKYKALKQSGESLDADMESEGLIGGAQFLDAFGDDGRDIPSHGMAKKLPTAALRDILEMQKTGKLPKNYAPLAVRPEERGMSSTTAGSVSYRNGPFILVGKKNGAFESFDDLSGILVNPSLEDIIPQLQSLFPNLVVRSYSGVTDVVAASKAAPNLGVEKATPEPVQPPETPNAPAIRINQEQPRQEGQEGQPGIQPSPVESGGNLRGGREDQEGPQPAGEVAPEGIAPAPAPQKEPWEMTLLEYKKSIGYKGERQGTSGMTYRGSWSHQKNRNAEKFHERLVADAIAERKTVPPAVLAEYPDLAPTTPSIQDEFDPFAPATDEERQATQRREMLTDPAFREALIDYRDRIGWAVKGERFFADGKFIGSQSYVPHPDNPWWSESMELRKAKNLSEVKVRAAITKFSRGEAPASAGETALLDFLIDHYQQRQSLEEESAWLEDQLTAEETDLLNRLTEELKNHRDFGSDRLSEFLQEVSRKYPSLTPAQFGRALILTYEAQLDALRKAQPAGRTERAAEGTPRPADEGAGAPVSETPLLVPYTLEELDAKNAEAKRKIEEEEAKKDKAYEEFLRDKEQKARIQDELNRFAPAGMDELFQPDDLLAGAKEAPKAGTDTVDLAQKAASREKAIFNTLEKLGWTLEGGGARMTVGSGTTGGQVNPTGKRTVNVEVRGGEIRAFFMDGLEKTVTVAMVGNAENVAPQVLARKLHDQVVKATVPAPQTEAQKAKEPWQMTQDEFIAQQLSEAKNGLYKKMFAQNSKDPVWLKNWKGNQGIQHQFLIEKAVREGQPVPAEVLADYPDLQSKPEAKEPAAEPVTPVKKPKSAKIPDSEVSILKLAGYDSAAIEAFSAEERAKAIAEAQKAAESVVVVTPETLGKVFPKFGIASGGTNAMYGLYEVTRGRVTHLVNLSTQREAALQKAKIHAAARGETQVYDFGAQDLREIERVAREQDRGGMDRALYGEKGPPVEGAVNPEGRVEPSKDALSVDLSLLDDDALLLHFGLDLQERLAKSGKTYWAVTGATERHKAMLDALGFKEPFKMDGVYWRSVFKENPKAKLVEALRAGGEVKIVPRPTLPRAEAEQVLKKAGLVVTQNPNNPNRWTVEKHPQFKIRGGNNPMWMYKDLLADLGGVFNRSSTDYKVTFRVFDYDPTEALGYAITNADASGSVAGNAQAPARRGNVHDDPRIRELRQRLDARSDGRLNPSEYRGRVSDDTQRLITEGGDRFHVPKQVQQEQIEDVGMMVRAFEEEMPAFILANAAGTGKTMVMGGAIRELRRLGHKKFVYVTQSRDLIEQIKSDLAAYGVDDVVFHTYAEMSGDTRMDVADAVIFFDEAHNIKNINDNTARAVKGQTLIQRARMSVFASATPFENPVQAMYLGATGLFEQEKAGEVSGFAFVDWAAAFGAEIETFEYIDKYTGKPVTRHLPKWVSTEARKKDAKASREWLAKQGILTQRPMRINPEMVDVEFSRTEVDPYFETLYREVEDIYDDALNALESGEMDFAQVQDGRMLSGISMHRENLIKRILEASKVPAAIRDARNLIDSGQNVVIFVETKADRTLNRWRKTEGYQKEHGKDDKLYDYPQMQVLMAEWDDQVKQWLKTPEELRGDYPKPPFADFIYHLAGFFYQKYDNKAIELPSTADEIVKAFGKKNVGVYTGAVSTAAANKAKEKFLDGELKILIATMAKGGTGLSLHDKVGNRPTTQLNINLPWTATQVEQVMARVARYGLQSKALVRWLFASNIDWEANKLAPRVGARMRDMGATVQGIDVPAAEILNSDFDFTGKKEVAKRQAAEEPAREQEAIQEAQNYGVLPSQPATKEEAQQSEKDRYLEAVEPDQLLTPEQQAQLTQRALLNYQNGELTRTQYTQVREYLGQGKFARVTEILEEVERTGRQPGVAFARTSKKAKMEADIEQMLALMSQSAYEGGYVATAIKETLQNSFDAVKKIARSKNGYPENNGAGEILIAVNQYERTITITDNGVGMTASEIQKYFLTLGGTGKGGVGSSGGMGLAKGQFLTGSEWFELTTTKNGKRSVLKATPGEIIKGKAEIITEDAPEGVHGTTLILKVPESYRTRDGETRYVYFPNLSYVEALKQPLLGPVDIYVQEDQKLPDQLPIGRNFDPEKNGTPFYTKATFSWGDADIYYGVKRKEDEYSSKHIVLSDGIFQFDMNVRNPNDRKKIPYDMIVNIQSKVPSNDPRYPFNNTRQGFRASIEEDEAALRAYLLKVAFGYQGNEVAENFKQLRQLPRVEVQGAAKEMSAEAKKAAAEAMKAYIQDAPKPKEAPTPPKAVEIANGKVESVEVSPTDPKKTERKVILDVEEEKRIARESKAEKSFAADKTPILEKVKLEEGIDRSKPVFHNNTSVDYITEFGENAAGFFSELGSIMVDFIESVGEMDTYSYSGFRASATDSMVFGGVSIDKGYRGVHVKVPYTGLFINPLAVGGAKTLPGFAESLFLTMVHEAAHTNYMGHDEGHTLEIHRLYELIADRGLNIEVVEKLQNVLYKYRNSYNQMRERFNESSTKNVNKPLNKADDAGTATAQRRLEADNARAVGNAQGLGSRDLGKRRSGAMEPADFPSGELGREPGGIDSEARGDELDSIRFSRSAARSQMAQEAVSYFGVTNNLSEAGYVLPDGTLLDFSGRSQAAEYQKEGDQWRFTGRGRDYLANQRSLDHREVADLPSIANSATKAMFEFQRGAKALRIDVLSGRVSANFADWTPAQMRTVMAIAKANDGVLTLDLDHPVTGRLLRSEEIEKTTPSKINAILQEESVKDPRFSRTPTPAPGLSRPAFIATLRRRFPHLSEAIDKMLARGEQNQKGGLVLVDSNDLDAIAKVFAEKTGRSLESARDELQASKSVRVKLTVAQLLDAVEQMNSWTDWYDRHVSVLDRLFGEDAALFQDVLSATSQVQTVKGNVTIAIKAYNQLVTGQPFTGFLGQVIKNLERIRSKLALEGAKISEYGRANQGEQDAIAVDRHIATLFFDTLRPSPAQIESAKARIRTVAKKTGYAPRQIQAALWAFNQVQLGKDPGKVQSYDTILEARADEILALRAAFAERAGRSVPAGREIVAGDTAGLEGQPNLGRREDGEREGVVPQYSKTTGQLQGFYDPKTGLTFAILPNLSEASAPGVFLHENVHAQQRADIDARAVELVNSRSTVKRPELRTFLNRVQARLEASEAANDPKEVSAYLIEELTATARLNGMSAADGKFLDWVDRTLGQSVGDWIRSIVKAMRGWAFRHGLLLKASSLSLDDLMAWAEAGVERTAAGQVELSKAGAMARGEQPGATFYSALTRAIQDLSQKKAPGSQWASILENLAKKGQVKQEELDWSGVKEWLQEQKQMVGKDELLQYIRNNTIKVNETELTSSAKEQINYIRQVRGYLYDDLSPFREELREIANKDHKIFDDNGHIVTAGPYWVIGYNGKSIFDDKQKFSEGYYFDESIDIQDSEYIKEKIYRELISVKETKKFIEKSKIDNEDKRYIKEIFDNYSIVLEESLNEIQPNIDTETRNTKWTKPGGASQRELVLTVPTIEPWNTDDETHYGDIAGGRAVAWVRFNTRTDEDGKQVLFIEEIQSKRHQEGREKGYGNWTPEKVLASDKFIIEIQSFEGGSEWVAREKEDGVLVAFGETKNEVVDKLVRRLKRRSVQDAPFKQTIAGSGSTLSGWAGLAFKRMLRYAAENGYERLAWTTGEQQAERYSLSQRLNYLAWEKNEDGTYNLEAENSQGQQAIYEEDMSLEDMRNTVGREIARQIESGEGTPTGQSPYRDWRRIEGQNLSTGGEGMKGFYDRLLPNEVNKYIKKWGTQVGQTAINTGTAVEPVHSIEITPAMVASVMKGQPLFSRTLTADELLSQVQSGQVDTLTPEQWAQVQRAFLQQSTDTIAPTGTQAPSFQNWFGASRIKNKAGQPLPMYHATEADFTVFDATKSGRSTTHPTAALGFFFTNDRGHAAAKYGSNVMEVYLAIEKPYAMTDADLRNIDTVEDAQAFRQKLEAQGYDGIVMPAETRTRYVAAFRSDQIKRTDNPTYTRGEKDIRFSKAQESPRIVSATEITRTLIQPQLAAWNEAGLSVEVVQSVADLPADLQARLPDDSVEGFYETQTGKVYLIADQLSSMERAKEVLQHEAVGHWASHNLRAAPEFVQILKALYRLEAVGNKDIVAIAKQVDAAQPGLDRFDRAEEIYSFAVERGLHEKIGLLRTWSTKLLQQVKAWLRRLGFDNQFVNTMTLNDVMLWAKESQQRLNQGGKGTYGKWALAGSRGVAPSGVEDIATQSLRPASTFAEAREAAKNFQGKPLVSADGITASVSRNNLDKMLSASAVHKSESTAEHALAVANLDKLFSQAVTGWTKTDRAENTNLKAIYRMFAPMLVGEKARLVKLTVKEFSQPQHGSKIYSVEAIEVGEVSPVPEMVDADRANGSRLLTGPTRLVESVVQRIQDFNTKNTPKVIDLRFSRALPPNQYEDAQGNIQDSEAFNPVNGRTELKEQRAIIQRLKEDGFWKTTANLAKRTRPAWLKLLTLQQKVEMLQDIKLLKDLANAFENTALAMDADKSNLKQEAFALAEEMRSEMVKARDKGYLLGRILQWSTLKNVVPYKVPERMFYGTTAEFVTATEDYQRLMGMVDELKASNPALLALYDKIMGKGTVDANGQKIPNMIERMDELYRDALQERLGRQALTFLKKTLESAQDTRQQTLWQHLRTLSQSDPTGYAQLQQTYQDYLSVIDPSPAQLAGWRDSLSPEQAVLWDDLLIREGRWRNRESQKQIQAMVDNAVDRTKTPKAGTLTAALRALHTQDIQAFTELRDALKLRLERYEPNSDQHDAIKNRLPPATQALFEQIVTSNNAAIARFSFKKKLERIKTTAPTPDTSLTGRLHTLFLKSADRFNALSKAVTTRLETLNMDSAKADALRAGLSDPADQALFDELVADAQAKVKPGLTALRELYESRRRAGPYFPLDRFGPYQVYAEREGHGKDGIGLPAFSTFETEAEQQRYVQRMQQEGWTVRTNYQIREALETQAPPNSFIARVFKQIDDTNAPEAERQALKNDIYQMYLQSLPELSARKHFMKRKGIPGFSGDALRSFAQLMNGKANAIARLRHSDKLTESLESMERVSKAMGQDPTQLADQNRARMIITELKDSFGWMMNPSNATWANRLTSLGFFWYLTNLSTSLVNLTQVPIWTFPELGSKFGAGRSLAVLNKTIADYGVWKLRRGEPGRKLYEKLRGEFNGELGLDLDRIEQDGIVSRTQAVTLAGMGEDAPEFRGGAAGTAAAAWEKTFKIVSWPFHKSEVANREISFIAAYRLARTSEQAQKKVNEMTAEGATPEAINDAVRKYAYDTARNVVLKTQGNYANYNRAPFMRSNIMRVITLFRSYAQMMTWRMLRDTYQAFKSADPQEKQEVKKRLGLMLASSFLWGGAMGLPIYTVAMSLAGLLFGNDPDDPYEPEEAMKQALRGLLGETGQQILMGGPVGQLPRMANLIPGIDGVTGVDLSPRVSADLVRLWMRRMPGDLEGESAWDWYVTQALGPMAGMGRNAFRAYGDLVSSAQGGGSLFRSLEGTMPAPIRNALKAARFEEEGVTTRRGDLLVPDTNWAMLIQQAVGFTPDTIAAQYAQNTARYEFKDALEKRRKGLTDRYIYAAREKDPELIKETLEFVKKFNRLNPETPITAKTLKAAYKQWLRARALSEGGVYEPSKGMRARLRREFAEETED